MQTHKFTFFGLIAFILAIHAAGCAVVKPSTANTPTSEDWTKLWDTFWASDDLEDVWPLLDEYQEQYQQANELPAFTESALPLIREAYEYAFFDPARKRLKALGTTLAHSTAAASASGSVYFELARSYFFSGQHDSLQYYLQESLSFYPQGSTETWDHYNLSGASFLVRENIQAAISDLLTAREKLMQSADLQAGFLLRIETNLGQAYQDIGDLSNALRYRLLALRSAEDSGEIGQAALPLTLSGLGNLYDELGRYEQAIDYYERALQTTDSDSRQDSMRLADLYLNTGVAHKNLGAYERAEANYWRAESIYLADEGTESYLALVYTNLANLSTLRADYRQAIELHQQARQLYLAAGDSLGLSATYTNIGFVHTKSEDWELALQDFQKAAAINRQLGKIEKEGAPDYLNLSDAHRQLGEVEAARAYADSAWQLVTQDSLYTPDRIYTFLALARVEQAANNRETALDWLDQSLSANLPGQPLISTDQRPPINGYLRYDYLFESILLRANLLANDSWSGSPEDDLVNHHFLAARELLSSHGRNLISQEDRLQLARFRYRLAVAGVDHAFERWESGQQNEWIETAFQFAEFAKAGVLREVLLGREVRNYAGIPPQLQEREDSLRANLALQRRELLQKEASAASSTRILSTETALAELVDLYKTDYPTYAEFLREEPPARLSAIQYALRPGQLMQYFFSSPDEIYGFTISKNAIAPWKTTINTQRFSRDIIALGKGITRRLDRVYRAKAQQLFQQLFPLPFPPGTDEVILVPDGDLLGIPFEALLTEQSAADEPDHHLPYLLRNYALSYSPSANLFYTSTAINHSSEEITWDGLVGFAPAFLDLDEIVESSTISQINPIRSPLPGTLQELTQLDSIFTAQGIPTSLFYHDLATEKQVYDSRLQEARFIHFATHGFVIPQHPELSGILLYPELDDNSYDDCLTAGEIFHLRISAELVVLSACETALGKLASGEGLLGLSRSFLHAGAQNLVVSLWPVQDEATAELMVELYQRILATNSQSLSSQLRAAKLELIDQQQWAHPYYWSPFILVGG